MTEDAEKKEAARKLFAGTCDFVLAASEPAHLESLPIDMPEVAFWGRSNVGKSSLINALTNRKGLARTSNTPGRTRQIIFFNVRDELLLADLPGYGHAKASKTEIKIWNGFIRTYLRKRANLRCVYLLVDGRHGLKEIDEEKMAFLDEMAVSYQIILTKCDQNKDGGAELAQNIQKTLKKHPAAHPQILLTSADKKEGLEGVRLAVYGFVGG
jgi:GTP-binding protein